MKQTMALLALLGLGFTTSGCALGLAAGAGAVVADEVSEKDGEFDPLEEAYDGDPDTAPIVDED